MVDNRLVTVDLLSSKTLRNMRLDWFVDEIEDDYLIDQFIEVEQPELDEMLRAAEVCHTLAVRAARWVSKNELWSDCGIPKRAIPLVRWSLINELNMHLHGRFDFAGGLKDRSIKLLEYNADTCSLMPETVYAQEAHWKQEADQLDGEPFNPLLDDLIHRFQDILAAHPDRSPSLLVTTLGHEEDWLNAEVIIDAAKQAGFEDVQSMLLERVIFSPEEGFFVELMEDEFRRYDFLYKFIPWDFIAYEEPDLLDLLTQIVMDGHGVVINPAYGMLLQSKGLMKVMFELEPENPYLLKTSLEASDFPDHKYVKKPVFGRMGENISMYDGSPEATYSTDGDYGAFPAVYQSLAPFNIDSEGHRYQPSIYYSGRASALCFRRQDDLIVDDDAEFVGHVVV